MKKFITLFLVIVFCFASFGTAMSKEEVIIAVWSGPEAEELKSCVQPLEEQTGLSIIVDEIARDAYRTKLSAALMSGTQEWDVVYLIGEWLPEFAKAGTLDPISGLFTQEELDKLPGYENAIYQDELWGLVVGYHTNFCYYRKDLYEEAGLEVPTTWDEYLENAIALTKDIDGDGQIDIFGNVVRGSINQNSIHYDFANYFLGHGADWLDENYKPILNSEAGVEALTYFVDMQHKYKVMPPDTQAVGYMEKNQYLQSGKVAQCIQWIAAFNDLINVDESSEIYGKIGITLVPGKKVGNEMVRGSLATCDTWVIPKNAFNKAAAETVIRWFASDEGAKYWAISGGDPLNITAYSDPEVLKVRPDFEIAREGMKYAKQFPIMPEAAELMETWSRYLGLALSQQLTPKEALDQCAEEWEKILSERGYYN